MPIPDYQSLMLPVLKLAEGGEIQVREATDRLAEQLRLTPEERAIMLPSGGRTLLANRMHWAKSYMLKAGLVHAPRRGYFTITDRGRELLAGNPARIDNETLMRFEEFREFLEKSRSSSASEDQAEPAGEGKRASTAPNMSAVLSNQTPDEAIRSAVHAIEETLAKDLIDRILAASPAFFENAVVSLLLAMGYGGSREDAGRAIGRSGDGGLDGVIDEDALGLDRVYVQAKRYAPENAVGEPEIRGFAGSLGAVKANKGVFVTTSRFTRSAEDFVVRTPNKIVLIDGDMLATLMIRYGVGVRTEQTILVKKIDEDFFLDE